MQIVTLLAVYTKDDTFSWSAVTGNNTKALAEIVLSIKVITYLELHICKRDFLYAVKRIDTIVVTLFFFWSCITMEVSKHVPTLVEQLQAIWFKVNLCNVVRFVSAILHRHTHFLLHGIDERLQVVITWNLLKHDTVMQSLAVRDYIVDRHCRYNPVLNRIFMQHILVTDVVLVTTIAVAVDVDTEDVLNGILMAIKGRASELHSPTHLRVKPLFLNLSKSNSTCSFDSIHEPDVFFEKRWYCHIFPFPYNILW